MGACTAANCPRGEPTSPAPPASTPAGGPVRHVCYRYDNAAIGQFVVRRATYERKQVGLTPGQRAEIADAGDDPYGMMWDCLADAKNSERSWCECTRGPSQDFEVLQSKTGVRWIEAPQD